MLYARLARQLKFHRIRHLHSTIVKNENKSVSETSTKTQPSKSTVDRTIMGAPLHTVGTIDRIILVWVKRFPSMDKVPPEVTIDCIRRAHTMFRIRVSFIIMAFGIIGFIVSAMIGKRDIASGKNLQTERVKWHQEIREKAKREAAANATDAE